MKAYLICWKKAKGENQKRTVVVKGLQKDWDRFYSKEMCSSFSVKRGKKEWSQQICKKSLFRAISKGWLKTTTGAPKGLHSATVCSQSCLISVNPSPESR